MQKVRVQAMVKPEVLERLKRHADGAGVSVSNLAGNILEQVSTTMEKGAKKIKS